MHGRHSPQSRISRITDKLTLFRVLGLAAPVGMIGAMAPGAALASTPAPHVPEHPATAGAEHKVIKVAKRIVHKVHHKKAHKVARVVTVEAGDTLSAIARRDCGSAAKWPALFAASRKSLGPDPDVIFAGEKVTLDCNAAPARTLASEHHKAAHHPKAHHLKGHRVGNGMVETRGGHLTPQHVVKDAIRFARHQIGKPYLWGGTGAGGFDCSGLVMEAYLHAGLSIPRTSQAQFTYGDHVTRPRKGDLVFFGSTGGPHHVGLVIGHGKMIEASQPGVPLRIAHYTDRSDVAGFTRPWLAHHAGVSRHKIVHHKQHHAAVEVSIRGTVGTVAHGMLPANYRTIYNYLRDHGYSGDAAAGILGNMWQESHGNPESGTPSAGGLIGWTGNWSNYSSSAMQTGNPRHDLKTQLRALLRYNEVNGSRADINAHATSAAAAASHYCFSYERPGIPALSNRVAAAEAVAHAEGLAR